MAAYLATYIYGNEDFGGYFSVDGESSIPVEHDTVYTIEPGHHRIDFYSTSNVQRKAGRLQAAVYNNTSSSGALFDALERREALKNLGDHWTIDVFVGDDQMIVLSVQTQGNKIVGSPSYAVEDLTEEQCEMLEEFFEELEQEIIEEQNRPKRSKGKIAWGIILTVLGLYASVIFYVGKAQIAEDYPTWTPYVVIALFLGIGVPLLIDGFRKKQRG